MRALLLAFVIVAATPGPESTAIVANANNVGSVDLAFYYALKRGIPENQICLLSGLPTTSNADISMSDYLRLVLTPLQNCLASRNGSLTMNTSQYSQALGSSGSVLSRIEAFVLMMGMPMRVVTEGNIISIQQCLSAWYISYSNSSLFVTTSVSNTFSKIRFSLNSPQQKYWDANYSVRGNLQVIYNGYVVYGPWKIVTSLNARSFPYAKFLVDQALLAEQQGKQGLGNAKFVWMLGNGVTRGSMDFQYQSIADQLAAASLPMINVTFNSSWLSPTPIAGFICGTSTLGSTIENNTYSPHCIIDDLTSFGASPNNFKPSGQVQVAITRWNMKGCLGAHGTVTEPYSDAFPARQFMVDYALGNTMSEAYYRWLPSVLWMNYVVGDAMAAPFAVKPLLVITLDSVLVPKGVQFSPVLTAFQNSSNLTAANYRSFTGSTLSCTCCLMKVNVSAQGGKSIASVQVFIDGVLWVTNSSFRNTLALSSTFSLPTLNKNVSILVVAQHNSTFREKVWFQRWVRTPASRTCSTPAAATTTVEISPTETTQAEVAPALTPAESTPLEMTPVEITPAETATTTTASSAHSWTCMSWIFVVGLMWALQ